MDKMVWIALAFVAGCAIPLNGAFNARLGAAAGSPLHASLISFAVGTAAIAAYVLATRQSVSWGGFLQAPWYAWLAGIFGAFSLTVIILTYPRLGPGLGFGLVVAGQLLASILLEHFNILVAEAHPITSLRLLGLAFVLGGVVLIRTF